MVGGLVGGVTLDRLQNDLPAFVFSFFLRLLGDLLDHRANFAFAFILNPLEQHFFGLLDGNIGDLQQFVFLLLQRFVHVRFFCLYALLAGGHAAVEVVEVTLFDGQRVELFIHHVFALGEPLIKLIELAAGRFIFALELFLRFKLFLLGGQLDFFGFVFRLLPAGGQQFVGLMTRLFHGAAGEHLHHAQRRPRSGDQSN